MSFFSKTRIKATELFFDAFQYSQITKKPLISLVFIDFSVISTFEFQNISQFYKQQQKQTQKTNNTFCVLQCCNITHMYRKNHNKQTKQTNKHNKHKNHTQQHNTQQ